MAKGIARKLNRAVNRAYAAMNQHDGGKYGRGLSSEGYIGGYVQALADVQAALSGVQPSDPRGFWKEGETSLDKQHPAPGGDV